MKVHEMEVLIRVAEAGSMTVAARQMHLTPAAVSAMIGRVEDALGVRIFERTTRAIRATDEGLTVLDGCQEVVARWERLIEEVRGTPELAGSVHLSAPADATYQVIAPVVAEVSEANPKLRVVFHTSDVVHRLHEEKIDMAIRYGALQDSTLSARKLTDCPGVLVASPTYLERWGAPRTPEDLRDHRCLTLQLSSTAVTSWTLHLGDLSCEVPLRSRLCGDGYLARRWALEGMGIARKNLFDVIDDLEVGRLVRVLPTYTSGGSGIHAVFPSRRYLPARVRAVDSALAKEFATRAARCNEWLRRETAAPDARPA